MKIPFLLGFVFLLVFASIVSGQTESPGISGRVLRAGSNDPVARAVVTLTSATGEQNRTEVRTTAADGTFRFDNLGPGQYRVSVERYSYIKQEYGQRSFNGTGMAIAVGA